MNIIKTFGVLSALIASTATVSAQTLMEPLRKDFTTFETKCKDQNAIFRCLVRGVMGQEMTSQDSMPEENFCASIAAMNHKLRTALEQNHADADMVKTLKMKIERDEPIQKQAQKALAQKNDVIAQQNQELVQKDHVIERIVQENKQIKQENAELKARITELEHNQQ